jgi:signal transduction histidine kinase
MKILIGFFTAYIIAIILILTIHSHLSTDYKSQIATTNSELSGLTYLKVLQKLSNNIASLNHQKNSTQNRKRLQEKVLLNIENLYALQKENKNYISQNFNINLEKLKQFNMSTQDCYNFLELIGLENYRIGDISKLLFERNRKIYFLSSLATHYMPEYLTSLLISRHIIKELKESNSHFYEDTFTEQTKLVSLSSEEIYVIIKEISQYKDSRILFTYMTNIFRDVERLTQTIKHHTLFHNDKKGIKKYLKLSKKIILKSFLLNNTYMKIIDENLHNRLKRLKNDELFLHIALSLIVLLITALFFYIYQLYRGREKQHKHLILEQKKTQNALAFKSRFLSNMSHEIRTPLNTIVGLIKVLEKTTLTQKQSDILSKIDNAGELLLGIINDILDIAKIESGKLQIIPLDFELKKMLNDIKDMFIDRANAKNVNLEIQYENIENYHFIGDSLRISQILINFISNAIKFTDNGNITLKVKSSSNNLLLFEVIDDGIGIKEECISSLFEEFTQADMNTTRKYGGTGLGLAISKNLVELMGGEISVKSEYGVGSTFSFTLNLPASKNSNSKELKIQKLDELEDEVNQLENITILIAEDNKMNQTLIDMLLEDSKLILEFANDGKMAVDMFKEKAYDLILMDIQMPNMNGYEATKQIREINQSIPILALSANVMQEDIEKSISSGMNCHLAKPIDIEKLYTELLRFLKQ